MPTISESRRPHPDSRDSTIADTGSRRNARRIGAARVGAVTAGRGIRDGCTLEVFRDTIADERPVNAVTRLAGVLLLTGSQATVTATP